MNLQTEVLKKIFLKENFGFEEIIEDIVKKEDKEGKFG